MRRQIHGILLLDKPATFTSNGALQKIKRLFNAKKAGHTGSLDPIATGMLPICLGDATKFAQFLLESNKSYHVTAKLGVTTTTGDSEGEIVTSKPVPALNADAIQLLFNSYLGDSLQVPPMFSAIKHQGRPLYELARKGIEVDRKPRKITIFSMMLDNVNEDELVFDVECSKGTYIRTLVEQIGEALQCGAHVTALRRTAVYPYHNSLMYTLNELETIADTQGFAGLDKCLLPLETSVEVFPAVTLSTSAAFYLRMGQPVRTSLQCTSPLVRLMTEDASFLGMGEVLPDGRVKPHRLISQS